MKNLGTYIVAIILLLSFPARAQEAVVSGGNIHETNDFSISWGLGELVIQTFIAGDNVLTQGFQQSKLSATAINEIPGLDFSISVYPNPTSDFVNLEIDTDDYDKYRYQLVEQGGIILQEESLNAKSVEISFQNYKAGVFLLRVLDYKRQIKVFKVFKQ